MFNKNIISTGISSLDTMLDGGYHPESLNIIAGQTAVGKTALATCIAWHAAQNGNNIMYISCEDSPHTMLARFKRHLLQRESVDKPLVDEKPLSELHFCKNVNFLFCNQCSVAELVLHSFGVDRMANIIFIDNMKLLTAPDSSAACQNEIIDKSLRDLKKVAVNFNAAIFVVCHLNRNRFREKRKDFVFSDIAGPETLCSYADTVLFIPDQDDEHPNEPDHINLKLKKNRRGSFGDVPVYRELKTYTFK